MGERWLCKPEVIGSIPFGSTKDFLVHVECHHGSLKTKER